MCFTNKGRRFLVKRVELAQNEKKKIFEKEIKAKGYLPEKAYGSTI